MKISSYTEFVKTIEASPSVCIFALDNGSLNEEWRSIFDAAATKYKSSMFLRFCIITRPFSENSQFLKTINDASCLIVNHTTNSAITSTLCDDLGSVPLSVCTSSLFPQTEFIPPTQPTQDTSLT